MMSTSSFMSEYIPPPDECPGNQPPLSPSDLLPVSDTVSYSTTPTLSALYSDPDGHSGRVDFRIETLEGTPVASGHGSWVASGQRSAWSVPGGVLEDYKPYVWTANAWDGASTSTSEHAAYETEPGPDQGDVFFASPLQVADAITWAELRGLRPLKLFASYEYPDEAIQLGHIVGQQQGAVSMSSIDGSFGSSENASAAEADYTETMSNVMSSVSEDVELDDQATQDQRTHISWIEASISAGDTPTDSIVVSGSTETLVGLRSDSSVASVIVRSEEEGDVGCDQGEGPPDPWWPYRGRVHTKRERDKHGNLLPRRSIYQSFKWAGGSLANLQSNWCTRRFRPDPKPAYEADAHFELDGGTYLGEKTSWASNMPAKYYDTNFDDAIQHDTNSWTVGTRSARDLSAGRLYWTKVWTTLGRASSDRGYIYGQAARRGPACRWSWCVRAVTAQSFISGYNAPSLVSWP